VKHLGLKKVSFLEKEFAEAPREGTVSKVARIDWAFLCPDGKGTWGYRNSDIHIEVATGTSSKVLLAYLAGKGQ